MSTIVQFPGTPVPVLKERRSLISEILGMAELLKMVGVTSRSDLKAVARNGGVRSIGTFSIRPSRASKTTFEDWGFDLQQLNSSKADRFEFLLELGSESRSVTIPLALVVIGARVQAWYSCPTCGALNDGWLYLACVVGRGWMCRECWLKGRWLEDGTFVDSVKSVLRLEVDSREHSTDPRRKRATYRVERINRTKFFEERPNLFDTLPGIYSVYVNDWHRSSGHFVADRRHMPVIESKYVRVVDDWTVQQ